MNEQRHGQPIPEARFYLLDDFPGDIDVLIGLASPIGEPGPPDPKARLYWPRMSAWLEESA